jgi:hypothetical protein
MEAEDSVAAERWVGLVAAVANEMVPSRKRALSTSGGFLADYADPTNPILVNNLIVIPKACAYPSLKQIRGVRQDLHNEKDTTYYPPYYKAGCQTPWQSTPLYCPNPLHTASASHLPTTLSSKGH